MTPLSPEDAARRALVLDALALVPRSERRKVVLVVEPDGVRVETRLGLMRFLVAADLPELAGMLRRIEPAPGAVLALLLLDDEVGFTSVRPPSAMHDLVAPTGGVLPAPSPSAVFSKNPERFAPFRVVSERRLRGAR